MTASMPSRFVVQRIESDETSPLPHQVPSHGDLLDMDRRVVVFWATPIDAERGASPRRFCVVGMIEAGCAWPADSEVLAIRPGFVFTPLQ